MLTYITSTLNWMAKAYEGGAHVSTGEVSMYTLSDDYEYLLEFDANYAAIDDEWVGLSKEHHSDILWFVSGKPARRW